MTDDTLTPIASLKDTKDAQGRQADILATILAAIGSLLSVIAAIWFFAGFAENDTRPEHLTSALVLTLLLFAFAIIPFSLVTWFGKRAYSNGAKQSDLLWTLFLMLPWIVLGTLTTTHTPLPLWAGIIITTLATLLSIWAVSSLFLDRQKFAKNGKNDEPI